MYSKMKSSVKSFVTCRASKKLLTILQVGSIFITLGLTYIVFDGSVRHYSYNDVDNLNNLKRSVQRFNKQQKIINEEVFGPLMNNSVIIVVQVHKRITYLRHLIVSLAQARDISNTLLIFSHDFYDEEINELVQSIDFCKVMQIFYPFSIQMHPNEFPGTDPKDCKRDMKKEQAQVVNCQNANYPDLYGHYREAAYTQTKHHWWWKANRVFDQLEATRHHTGLVLFLEEDHYVAEDFLHFLNLMQDSSSKLCPECEVFTVGNYDMNVNFAAYDKVSISSWISSKHNMGMSLNKTTWNRNIKSCTKHFCFYDDYNWDWSLLYTTQKCLKSLTVMFAKMPRVFHIGENGLHHTKIGNQTELSELTNVKKHLKKARKYSFPENLTVHEMVEEKFSTLKPNGGWSDIRDVRLCLSFSL